METLNIEVLKEWRDWHLMRSRDTTIPLAKRMFHHEAHKSVGARLTAVSDEKWNPTGKAFEWKEFCAQFRPAKRQSSVA